MVRRPPSCHELTNRPKAFDVETEAAPKAAEAAGSDDDEEDALPENPNRRHVVVDQSDSEDAWEESDDE